MTYRFVICSTRTGDYIRSFTRSCGHTVKPLWQTGPNGAARFTTATEAADWLASYGMSETDGLATMAR